MTAPGTLRQIGACAARDGGGAGHLPGAGRRADAPAVHSAAAVEPFAVFAEPELSAAAPWVRGVCFNVDCGARFDPSRDWQIYCSAACRRASEAEARLWGARAALPILIWRLWRYDPDPARRATVRAARRYLTHLQSAWRADRLTRAERARG